MKSLTFQFKWLVSLLLVLLVSCSNEPEIIVTKEPDPKDSKEPDLENYLKINPTSIEVGKDSCNISITVESSYPDIQIFISDLDKSWIKQCDCKQNTYYFSISDNESWKRIGRIKFTASDLCTSTVNIIQSEGMTGITSSFLPGDEPYSIKIHIKLTKEGIHHMTKESCVTYGCFYGIDSTKLDRGGKYFEFVCSENIPTDNFGHIYPFGLFTGQTKVFAKPFYTTANHVVYGKTQTYLTTWENPPAPQYELPLVFHLLTDPQYEANHINDNLIEEIVATTNLIFRGCSRDYKVDWIPTDTKISFRVAEIVRYNNDETLHIIEQSQESARKFIQTGMRKIQYDPKKYINIWVMDCNDVNGIGSLPFITSQGDFIPGFTVNDYITDPPLDRKIGIVITNMLKGMESIKTDWRYTVLSHELGHYLGLYHPFTENGCNDTNDFCDDTPNYDRSIYLKSTLQLQFNRVGCDGNTFVSTNVMDYHYTKRLGFTPNQQERMMHAIKYGVFTPKGD